jgi:dihydrofolate synthase/folylpolyglutamate synthase
MDHTQFLGTDPASIAAEKAGIIKHGVPVIIGETQPETAAVFEAAAQATGSRIVFADRHARVSRSYRTAAGHVFYMEQNGVEAAVPVVIDLNGYYQRKNIVTVLIALQVMRRDAGVKVAPKTVLPSLAHAAQTTGLRGRWQQLRKKPLTVCDIAHNPAGWMWVKRQIERYVRGKLHIVVGFVSDKDISGMLKLMPRNAVYYFAKASIPRALDETELMKQAAEQGLSGTAFPTVAVAVEAALKAAADSDMIYIGGSAFVVAEALPLFNC